VEQLRIAGSPSPKNAPQGCVFLGWADLWATRIDAASSLGGSCQVADAVDGRIDLAIGSVGWIVEGRSRGESRVQPQTRGRLETRTFGRYHSRSPPLRASPTANAFGDTYRSLLLTHGARLALLAGDEGSATAEAEPQKRGLKEGESQQKRQIGGRRILNDHAKVTRRPLRL